MTTVQSILLQIYFGCAFFFTHQSVHLGCINFAIWIIIFFIFVCNHALNNYLWSTIRSHFYLYYNIIINILWDSWSSFQNCAAILCIYVKVDFNFPHLYHHLDFLFLSQPCLVFSVSHFNLFSRITNYMKHMMCILAIGVSSSFKKCQLIILFLFYETGKKSTVGRTVVLYSGNMVHSLTFYMAHWELQDYFLSVELRTLPLVAPQLQYY